MGCRVGISTDSDASWKSESLFGSNNVHNTLTLIGHSKVLESKVLDILFQLHNLCSTGGFFNKGLDVNQLTAIFGRNIVVNGSKSTIGTTDSTRTETKSFKGLRRGHLMNQVSVDVQQGGISIVIDKMVVPDLIVQSAWSGLKGGCGRRLDCSLGTDRVEGRGYREDGQEGGEGISHDDDDGERCSDVSSSGIKSNESMKIMSSTNAKPKRVDEEKLKPEV
mmetsp:Transcript_46269/g.112138  ORF Transcript_46269/g.112138 Transcript_46269/m.112138 type:complete len:221 (-) Transcript_46269:102-764(-)